MSVVVHVFCRNAKGMVLINDRKLRRTEILHSAINCHAIVAWAIKQHLVALNKLNWVWIIFESGSFCVENSHPQCLFIQFGLSKRTNTITSKNIQFFTKEWDLSSLSLNNHYFWNYTWLITNRLYKNVIWIDLYLAVRNFKVHKDITRISFKNVL